MATPKPLPANDDDHNEHTLRCRAFVVRTQGRWSVEARQRLDAQLSERNLAGPTDATLDRLRAECTTDAVYLCQGSSCRRTPLEAPAAPALPVRPVACLGACLHAPNAHRVVDGVGHTYARLNGTLLEQLAAGKESPDLERRRWEAGAAFPQPDLAPLDAWVGRWSGGGGFLDTPGCTRTVHAAYTLGGRFFELAAENVWPTVTGGVDRYPERYLLQPGDAGRCSGVRVDYLGTVDTLEGVLVPGRLEVWVAGRPDRRTTWTWVDPTLSERHERRSGDDWRLGFRATLTRVLER